VKSGEGTIRGDLEAGIRGEMCDRGRAHRSYRQFGLDLHSQHDVGVTEKEKGTDISRTMRPAMAVWEKAVGVTLLRPQKVTR
jgi:hypothetical protein